VSSSTEERERLSSDGRGLSHRTAPIATAKTAIEIPMARIARMSDTDDAQEDRREPV
jgi:hypothetical protein